MGGNEQRMDINLIASELGSRQKRQVRDVLCLSPATDRFLLFLIQITECNPGVAPGPAGLSGQPECSATLVQEEG